MKPKTIDEILNKICLFYDDEERWIKPDFKEAKQQLLDLFISCVPETADKIPPHCEMELILAEGFNDCRNQMIKNLEKLK